MTGSECYRWQKQMSRFRSPSSSSLFPLVVDREHVYKSIYSPFGCSTHFLNIYHCSIFNKIITFKNIWCWRWYVQREFHLRGARFISKTLHCLLALCVFLSTFKSKLERLLWTNSRQLVQFERCVGFIVHLSLMNIPIQFKVMQVTAL